MLSLQPSFYSNRCKYQQFVFELSFNMKPGKHSISHNLVIFINHNKLQFGDIIFFCSDFFYQSSYNFSLLGTIIFRKNLLHQFQ